ncbi:hypothetical protein pipiens_010319 [Culex pipiens pipiens]|uniref:Metalloendopeptidase n=1 Tax=Culex pipiens pipiens TaxID=38569 RepID=A0ABD1DAN5_CULPP
MKNFLILVLWATLTNGVIYHPYEEIGRLEQGDLLVKTIVDDSKGTVRTNVVFWSESTVPYVLGTGLTTNQKFSVRFAMDAIEHVSCVRFVPRAITDSNYVSITMEQSGCWAALGMHGGRQQINLDPRGCMDTGSILHQLMHTLGFTHPSNRADRDLYVEVNTDNVKEWEQKNMEKSAVGEIDDFGMTYDYESIMHRSELAFTVNGKPTILPLHANIELGQRDRLSHMDIKKLNKMYPCV